MTHPPDWYGRRRITLAGCRSDRAHRSHPAPGARSERPRGALRSAADRHGLAADHAAGSRAASLDGVISFRDLRDVESMLTAARTQRSAIVIGGGLLGLEAAHGLRRRGMSVTVVHIERASDGASARRAGRRAPAHRIRAARHRVRDARQGRANPGRNAGHRRAGWPMAASSPATWWSWRSESAPTSTWRAPRDCIAIGACSWTTRCSPTTRRSMPWASVCSTAAEPSAWSPRCSSRPESAPPIWPSGRFVDFGRSRSPPR